MGHLSKVEENAENEPTAVDYHYCDGTDLTAQYVIVLDALNFCFWPLPDYQYEHLARGLKNAVLSDTSSFSAERLAVMTPELLATWLARPGFEHDKNNIPLIDERARAVRELGCVLLRDFNGQAADLVRNAHGSAETLVQLVTAHFPMFRDHSIYAGHQSFFYKRAQIFVGDLYGAFGGCGLGAFSDLASVTCFADYRIPQLLRPLKILVYNQYYILSPSLAARVDALEVLCPGSEEELEIRAGTVVAVDRMVAALARKGHTCNAIRMDWLLWNRGETMHHEDHLLEPHHRTLTIYY